MRIVFFSEVYRPTINGVVTSLDSFAKELTKRGHEVSIFAPSNPRATNDSKNIFRVPSTGLLVNKDYFWSRPGKETYRRLQSLKPDILHTHNQFGLGWFALKSAKKLNIPLVATYHTLLPDYVHYVPLLGKFEPFKSLLVSWLNSQTVKLSQPLDGLIAPSRALALWLKKIGVMRKIEVVSTGINLQDYRQDTRDYIAKKHSLNPNDKLILYAGRLSEEKNVGLLIDSFAKVRQKNPHTHLLLVGAGPKENQYKKQAAKLNIDNAVTFTGFIEPEETKKYFCGVDIFAFPSITDTQGVVVAQALAGGCAVLACDRLGPKDIIKNNINGLLVEPTLEDFSYGLKKLTDDDNLRKQLIGNAKKTLNSLSVEEQTDKLVAIYDNLVNPHAR